MLMDLLNKVRSAPAPLRGDSKLKLGNMRVKLEAVPFMPKAVRDRVNARLAQMKRSRKKKRKEINKAIQNLQGAVQDMRRRQTRV